MALALLAAALVLGLVIAPMPFYQRLCAGPLDVYPSIAAAARQAERDARAPQPSAPSAAGPGPSVLSRLAAPVAARAAAAWSATLRLVLVVKQSDPVAFSGHYVTAFALQAAHCAPSAIDDQWIKAAVHAWAALPAQLTAQGLAQGLTVRADHAAVLQALADEIQGDPYHVDNVQRVASAYRALYPNPSD